MVLPVNTQLQCGNFSKGRFKCFCFENFSPYSIEYLFLPSRTLQFSFVKRFDNIFGETIRGANCLIIQFFLIFCEKCGLISATSLGSSETSFILS